VAPPWRRRWRALARLLRLRWRLRAHQTLPEATAHPGFLALVDPWCRARLIDVVRNHCPVATEADPDGVLARSVAVTDWISAPLVGAGGRAA
jgi:hypothetical protein